MRSAIVVDPNSSMPIHAQIYEAWRHGILNGRFRGGERMPSTRELSQALGVARGTVAQAYEQLLAEGYLQAARGSGTFVAKELPDDLRSPRRIAGVKSERVPDIRLSEFGKRLNRDFLYPPQLDGVISFAQWMPDFDKFPMTVWRKLMQRVLRTASASSLRYARDPQGDEALRHEVAAYLARSRAVHCTAEQVVIVNGSQQALDLCARILAEPGDRVAFEDPGYLGTRRVFGTYGLRLEPARVDAEGVCVDELHKKSRLVYVTPSHQFPTGVAMSLQRRLELLNWARTHGAVLIEDDYDSEYRYSGPPFPALQGLAGDVPVVYCGSFSKVMFPSLRIGYVVVPTQLIAPFKRAKWVTDRHTPTIDQLVLADFIREGHLERHLRRMRKIYGKKRQVLVEALQKHFGERVRIYGDAAGMHLMAGFDDPDLAARAAKNKVQLVDARTYYHAPTQTNEFMLGFSSLGERSLREGVRRMAK